MIECTLSAIYCYCTRIPDAYRIVWCGVVGARENHPRGRLGDGDHLDRRVARGRHPVAVGRPGHPGVLRPAPRVPAHRLGQIVRSPPSPPPYDYKSTSTSLWSDPISSLSYPLLFSYILFYSFSNPSCWYRCSSRAALPVRLSRRVIIACILLFYSLLSSLLLFSLALFLAHAHTVLYTRTRSARTLQSLHNTTLQSSFLFALIYIYFSPSKPLPLDSFLVHIYEYITSIVQYNIYILYYTALVVVLKYSWVSQSEILSKISHHIISHHISIISYHIIFKYGLFLVV